MDIASIRYKTYRLFKRLTLGPVWGGPLGTGVCRTLEEGAGSPVVSRHISGSVPVASATVARYPFPKSFPTEFPREAAIDGKRIWMLSDVIVAPASGLVRIPDGPVLQQSAGSLPRLFNQRIADVFRSPERRTLTGPAVLLPNGEYYHILVEHLPNLLLSLRHKPSAKVLLPSNRHVFVDRMLDFVGVPVESRVEFNGPVRVQSLAFAPLWVNSGFIPECDLAVLRDAILSRIPVLPKPVERLYISRTRSRNRPLGREVELETELARRGFRICYFEEMPLAEQFAAIHQAKIVIAPHGAGLANLVAAKPGLRVLELLSRNWFNTCYAKLAVQIGCDYRYLETINSDKGYHVPVESVLEEIDHL